MRRLLKNWNYVRPWLFSVFIFVGIGVLILSVLRVADIEAEREIKYRVLQSDLKVERLRNDRIERKLISAGLVSHFWEVKKGVTK